MEIIPNELLYYLQSIIDEKTTNMTNISKHFVIQTSYFVKINDQWLLKNIFDIGNESVKIINLKINHFGETHIKVYSSNYKYPPLIVNQRIDPRYRSVPDKIYACDLYDEMFLPLDFHGKCFTGII